ncbi:MAG TPA: hypothetical protein VHI13_22555 [Candidatus Kapabacteria bacterium]|nr:hypothetical protein [Candidatus Kapabacteria bacterium]
MTPIFKSLEQISTGYTVFEKDQVLTHEQLNSLADYADDQIRLTRVKLLGVGLACGLRVSLANATVSVTRGVGVTTDGDLLYLDADTNYVQFKAYDASYPAYAPLYQNGDINGTKLPAYELLTAGVTDADAHPLSSFTSLTTRNLTAMTALLLMESYVKDDDLCSGVDCDNLGNTALNTAKLILIDTANVAAFLENVPTARSLVASLPFVVPERPVLQPSINTPSGIAGMYRAVCTRVHNNLVTALGGIYTACLPVIGGVFSADPASAWSAKLNQYHTTFATTDGFIQYYYDFLKDVVETYNTFRDLMFEDSSWCSPNAASFPKHLLLGNLATNPQAPDANRTGFYPSPITSRASKELDHARFLLRKIDSLINLFNPAPLSSTKITPSAFEDAALEERAIPYYYPVSSVPFNWSYRLYRRGAEDFSYSYNAGVGYTPHGGAADPFHSQIGPYSFFRIEGHIGRQISAVLADLKLQIKTNNIPIAVRAIMAGSDVTQITVKPVRYTDLHSIHYVLRQDLAYQLDDVTRFSTTFKNKIYAEPATATTSPEDCDCPSIRGLADTTSVDVVNRATAVRAQLDRPYPLYAADATWQDGLKNTMLTAGQFKANLGAVVKTDFTTPYDAIISSPHATLLPLLDGIIKKKDDHENTKLLMSNFIDGNPGIEHYAGVLRGGTFILVYDTNNNVVADFMVPYYIPEQEDATVDEPPIVRPSIKPDYILDNGIKVQPSRTTFVTGKLDAHAASINTTIGTLVDNKLAVHTATLDGKLAVQDQKVDSYSTFQGNYVNLFQSSLGMLGATVPRVDQSKVSSAMDTLTSSDSGLIKAVRDIATGQVDLTAATQNIATGQANLTAATQSIATGTQNIASGQVNLTAATQSIATGTQSIASGQAGLASAVAGIASKDSELTRALQGVATNTGSIAGGQAELTAATQSVAASTQSVADSQAALTAATQNVATNTGNLATSTGTIATNTGTIATNTGTIATSTGTVAANTGTIATNTGTIATSNQSIAASEQSIATSNQAIATSNQSIATNTGTIGTNTGTIATNTGTIGANTGTIATNTGNIAGSTANIATSNQNIATNTGTIGTNTGTIATNTGTIATNTGTIGANTGAIATSADKIATSNQSIATNTGTIGTNTGTIAANTGTIGANTGAIATNTGNIATNTSSIATSNQTIATSNQSIATNTSSIATSNQSIATSESSMVQPMRDMAGNEAGVANAAQNIAAATQALVTGQADLTQAVTDINVGGGGGAGDGGDPAISDEYLSMKVAEVMALARKITVLTRKTADAAEDSLREKYSADEDQAEIDLGDAVCDVIEYFIDNRMQVAAGTDQAKAVDTITPQLIWIGDKPAHDGFRQRMQSLIDRSGDATVTDAANKMMTIVS